MNDSNKRNPISSMICRLKKGKTLYYLIIAVSVFIAFLVIVYACQNKQGKISIENDVNAYVTNIENRLSDTLSKVKGAGKVSVVITVNSGKETVLAVKKNTIETSNGVETEETPILVNGDTVIIKEKYPDIVGVLIVAEGADKISVKRNIQEATMSLLDVELDQIEILTMKK